MLNLFNLPFRSIYPRRLSCDRRMLFFALLTAFAATAMATPSASSPNAPDFRSAATQQRIVILGDSLTAGFGLEDEQDYPSILEKTLIDANLDQKWTIVNAGVSGDTSADGLHRLDWLLRQPVSILIVALGGNDGLRGLNVKVTEANLQAIIDQTRAKYPDVRIFIAGMLMPPNMGQDYTTAFAAIFPRVAARNHATLLPFLLDGVAGKSDLNQPDGIHPNADGAKIVAANVWKYLEPMINADAPASLAKTP
jgi:acyl-CoA thioesterase-1